MVFSMHIKASIIIQTMRKNLILQASKGWFLYLHANKLGVCLVKLKVQVWKYKVWNILIAEYFKLLNTLRVCLISRSELEYRITIQIIIPAKLESSRSFIFIVWTEHRFQRQNWISNPNSKYDVWINEQWIHYNFY